MAEFPDNIEMTEPDIRTKIPDIVIDTFDDGKRSIDYVIVFENPPKEEEFLRNKIFFLANLVKIGLEIETETKVFENKIYEFVKLHIPWKVLTKFAEILSFRVPIKECSNETSKLDSFLEKVTFGYYESIPSKEGQPKYQNYLTSLYRKSQESKFIPSTLYPAYISNTLRITAVNEVLQTTAYDEEDATKLGINRMLKEGVAKAAYPLRSNVKSEEREYLKNHWASFSKWYKGQPLSKIRDYFGESFGFYFAWLGTYTTWLITPSIVGIIVFILNLATFSSDRVVEQVCNEGKYIRMCPKCDGCPNWNLSDICTQTKINSVFDSSFTVFYSVFVSIWAVMLVEFWKRKNAVLAYDWNTLDFEKEEERPRAEYLIRAMGKDENRTQKTQRFKIYAGFSFIIVMIFVVFICLFGIIVYKSIMAVVLYRQSNSSDSVMWAEITGGIINLIIILILSQFYKRLAYKLTEWEMHKTQTDFNNNLTLKVFIFQFSNIFAYLFYIAFLKGRFSGYPGNYNRIFGYRLESCTGGCLMELAQQLIITMVGEQIVNNIMEFVIPKMLSKFKKFRANVSQSVEQEQTEVDFLLPEHEGLFSEYYEMVIQFGYVTIFVASFPLAPLLAFLNNYLEIRLDARKLINDTRKPLPQRAGNIGIWSQIINFLLNIAVVTNAFLIAFTSEIIPRTLYRLQHNWDLDGYTEYSLSVYEEHGETCRYHGYRDKNGHPTAFYWELLAIRFAFVVVFEHFVFGMVKLIEILIPDIPGKIDEKVKQERYLSKLALYESL